MRTAGRLTTRGVAHEAHETHAAVEAVELDALHNALARLHEAEHDRDQLAHLVTGLLESTSTEVAVLDEHLRVVATNAAFRAEFAQGDDPTGADLTRLTGLLAEPAMQDVLEMTGQAVATGSERSAFVCERRRGPGERWLDVTVNPLRVAPGVVLRARDVSDLVRAARNNRADRAHDALTGLLSRSGLQELLDADLRRSGMPTMCVMMLDIDQFTVLRHTLGSAAGDEVVRQVAANLQRIVPDGGRVARLIGDTFCIAFHPESLLDVDRVSSEVRDMARQPVTALGRTVRITASVGSTLTEPDQTVDRAMQAAELAMQEASKRGGNRCVTWSRELAAPQEGMVRLWNALRSALQFRQMEVWFQPIVSLATDRPIGAEALCRWHHPQFGDVSPGEFIPIAEQNSEILNIGAFVHGRAAEVMNMLRVGRVQPMSGFLISVNASPNELAWPEFATNLLARLRANDAHPEWFALDVTEQALRQPDPAVLHNLDCLRDAGVTLSLDDFGTGYSSLDRLRDIPVSRVKIDRRFVGAMLTNDRAESLIAAIVALAEELGMQTVAEGVETAEQANRLRHLGCRAAQGFLYAPAVPDSELVAVLRDLNAVAATPRSPAAVHGG
jgi:diguanylate cyclase (GGDEF)-like protein